MSDRRCETCKHFVAWPLSSAFRRAEGVCTAPVPDFCGKSDREMRKWGGQTCQTWEMRDE